MILFLCSHNLGACLLTKLNLQLRRKSNHRPLSHHLTMIFSAKRLCDTQLCLASILTLVGFRVVQSLKNLLQLTKRIKMCHNKQHQGSNNSLRINLSNSNSETSHLYGHLAWVEVIRTTISSSEHFPQTKTQQILSTGKCVRLSSLSRTSAMTTLRKTMPS